MTKSTITRERAQQIFLGNGPEPSASEERELARMALAAMDSESWRLPLDYLQGHKDGMEWAARLAEANHPDTGDWLYDDPIELAKAIRKGPDMQPAQPAADSEPVAEVYQPQNAGICAPLGPSIRMLCPLEPGTNLYRHAPPPLVPSDVLNHLEHEANHVTAWHHMDEHSCKVNRRDLLTLINAIRDAQPAPPAPVVSADLLHTAASAIEDLLTTKDRTGAGVWFDLPFRLRSAANAQPAPVVPDDVLKALQKVARIRLDMDGFDGDRRGIADCLCDAEEALIEVVNRRAAMLHAGNSPAQSDCCPAQNSVTPAKSPIDHGYRPECECSGCKATARICAELSANSSANPGCWCRACRPVVLNDMRFVVCPDCGNKRCPRANDHRNACTGSNEPGQEGSAYPAAPQEAINALIPLVSRNEQEVK